MRRVAVPIAIAALLILAPLSGVSATDAVTLEGGFVWVGGDTSGDLEAVFTPTKTDGEWDVAFHFKFRGKSHTYAGTASGSLTSGDLSGTVQNEKKRRTFTFSGTVADGKFTGTHAETSGGRSSSTGTLTLGG